MKLTTKVFRNGNSQAVRIPKAFRLKSETVTIARTREGLVIEEASGDEERLKRFRSLGGCCPDFPEPEANEAANLPRDFE